MSSFDKANSLGFLIFVLDFFSSRLGSDMSLEASRTNLCWSFCIPVVAFDVFCRSVKSLRRKGCWQYVEIKMFNTRDGRYSLEVDSIFRTRPNCVHVVAVLGA